MKNNRIQQFLIAMILSVGMLFFAGSNILAEEENKQEGIVETITEPSNEPVTLSSVSNENVARDETLNLSVGTENGVGSENVDLNTLSDLSEGSDFNIAEDPSTEHADTYEDVVETINDAQISEGGAAAVAIPADPEYAQTIISDEFEAIADGETAKEKLDDATAIIEGFDESEVVEKADQTIDNYSNAAEAASVSTSEEVIESSDSWTDAASQALADAEAADTHQKASEAADRAEEAAEKAEAIATDAEEAVAEAKEKQAEAQTAYETAEKAYKEAIEQATVTLAEGHNALVDAVAKALDAVAKAEAYYNSVAEDKEAAIEARDAAKAQLDASILEFESALEELKEAIGGAAKDVAVDLGETVATGVGYSITDLIAKYYDGVVEADLETIAEYEKASADAGKVFAVNLYEKWNSGVDAEEKAKIQFTLTELLVRDLLREQRFDVVEFGSISTIDGIDTEKELGEGNYFYASNSDGISRYFKVAEIEGDLQIIPITLNIEALVETALPSLDDIVEKFDTRSIDYIIGKVDYQFGKSEQYSAVSEPDSEENTDDYVIYGYKYKGLIIKGSNLVIVKKDVSFDEVFGAFVSAIFGNSEPLEKLGSLTNSLDKVAGKYNFFSHSLALEEEKTKLALELINEYKSQGLYPDEDEQKKSYDELFEDYIQFILSQQDNIDDINDNLYGDYLNRFIQDTISKFVEDNRDNIVDAIIPARSSDSEEPDEEPEGEGFLSALSDIKNAQAASIGSIVSDLFSSISDSQNNDKLNAINWNWDVFSPERLFELFSHIRDDEELAADVNTIKEAVISGEIISEKSLAAITDILGRVKLTDNLKKVLADSANSIMGGLHRRAYDNLLVSIGGGKKDIKEAIEHVIGAGKNVISNAGDLAKAEIKVAEAEGKEQYASALNVATINAWVDALIAQVTYDNYALSSSKLAELKHNLEAANESLAHAEKVLVFLKSNAEAARASAVAAKEIADGITDYDLYVSGIQVTSKNADAILRDKDDKVTAYFKYDEKKKNGTLYLNNADIDVVKINEDFSAGIYAGDDFKKININVTGENTIKSSSKIRFHGKNVAGIVVKGELTIDSGKAKGENRNSLTVDLTDALNLINVDRSIGIYAGKDIQFKHGIVTVDAAGYSILGVRPLESSIGIMSETGDITVKNDSVVAAFAHEAVNSAGIIAASGTIKAQDDAMLTGSGDSAKEMSAGIVANSIIASKESFVMGTAHHADRSFGILVYENLKTNDKATVLGMVSSVILPSSYSYGIYADTIKAGDESSVRGIAALATNESIGIAAKAIETSKHATVKGTGFASLDTSAGIQAEKINAGGSSAITAEGGTSVNSYGIYLTQLDKEEAVSAPKKTYSAKFSKSSTIQATGGNGFNSYGIFGGDNSQVDVDGDKAILTAIGNTGALQIGKLKFKTARHAYTNTDPAEDGRSTWTGSDASELIGGAFKYVMIPGAKNVYYIWVSGTQVTSDNQSDVLGDGGSVVFNPASMTLALENAEIDVVRIDDDKSAGIFAKGYKAFTIEVKGENFIKADSKQSHGKDIYGIYVIRDPEPKGSLTFVSNDASSNKLTIDLQDATDLEDAANSYGIYADHDIRFDNVTVDVDAAGYTFLFHRPLTRSTGIYTFGDLYVLNGAKVAAEGHDAEESSGVIADGTITVQGEGSTLTGVSGKAGTKSTGILAENMKASGQAIVTGISDSADTSTGILVLDTLELNGSSVIGISSAKISKNSYGINAKTIKTTDKSFLSAMAGDALNESAGILAKTITADNSVILSVGANGLLTSAGIHAENITADNSTIDSEGKAGVRSFGIYLNKYDEDGKEPSPEAAYSVKASGTTEITAKGGTGFRSFGIFGGNNSNVEVNGNAILTAIGNSGALSISRLEFETSRNAYTNTKPTEDGRSSWVGTDASELIGGAFKYVKIPGAKHVYYIWVSGTRVTSDNQNDVLGDNTVKFIPAVTDGILSGTLELHNADIVVAKIFDDISAGIYAEQIDELTIKLFGENNAISASNPIISTATDNVVGIHVKGSDEQHRGKLTFVSGEEQTGKLAVDTSTGLSSLTTATNVGISAGNDITFDGVNVDVTAGDALKGIDEEKESDSFGIYSINGNILIDKSSVIRANAGTAYISIGTFAAGGEESSITVQGDSKLDSIGGTAKTASAGVASDQFFIKEQSELISQSGSDADYSIGIYANNTIIVTDNSILKATAGKANLLSAGASALSLEANRNAYVEIESLGANETSGTSYGIYHFDESDQHCTVYADKGQNSRNASNDSTIISIKSGPAQHSIGAKAHIFAYQNSAIGVTGSDASGSSTGIDGNVYACGNAIIVFGSGKASDSSVGVSGNVDIFEGSKMAVTTGNADGENGYSAGIIAPDHVNVSGSAQLEVDAEDTVAKANNIAVRSPNVSITGSGKLKVVLGEAWDSIGISSDNIKVSGDGELIVSGGNGYRVRAVVGNITASDNADVKLTSGEASTINITLSGTLELSDNAVAEITNQGSWSYGVGIAGSATTNGNSRLTITNYGGTTSNLGISAEEGEVALQANDSSTVEIECIDNLQRLTAESIAIYGGVIIKGTDVNHPVHVTLKSADTSLFSSAGIDGNVDITNGILTITTGNCSVQGTFPPRFNPDDTTELIPAISDNAVSETLTKTLDPFAFGIKGKLTANQSSISLDVGSALKNFGIFDGSVELNDSSLIVALCEALDTSTGIEGTLTVNNSDASITSGDIRGYDPEDEEYEPLNTSIGVYGTVNVNGKSTVQITAGDGRTDLGKTDSSIGISGIVNQVLVEGDAAVMTVNSGNCAGKSVGIEAMYITVRNGGTLNVSSGESLDYSAGADTKEITVCDGHFVVTPGTDTYSRTSYGLMCDSLSASGNSVVSVTPSRGSELCGGVSGNVFIKDTSKVYIHNYPTYRYSDGLLGAASLEDQAELHIQNDGGVTSSYGISGPFDQETGKRIPALVAKGTSIVEITCEKSIETLCILGPVEIQGDNDDLSRVSVTLNAKDSFGWGCTGIEGDVDVKYGAMTINSGNIIPPSMESDRILEDELIENSPFIFNANDVLIADSSIVVGHKLSEIYQPVSSGIAGSLHEEHSHININVGTAPYNFGVWPDFGAYTGSVYTDNSNLNIVLKDAYDQSIGILGLVDSKRSHIHITAGNILADSDPDMFDIRQSIGISGTVNSHDNSKIYVESGSSDKYSCGIVGNVNVRDISQLWVLTGKGDQANIGILGNATVTGFDTLSTAPELHVYARLGENGIAVAGKLTALNNSLIELIGSKQAIDYLDGNEPDVDGRGILYKSSLQDIEDFKHWNKRDDLRSSKFRWIRIESNDRATYIVVSGADQTWTQGSDTGADFRMKNTKETAEDVTYDHFLRVYVDGKELVRNVDYTAQKGSVIVTLKPSYLNKLAIGKHTLTTVFDNGPDTVTNFSIKEKVNPKPTPTPTPVPSDRGSSDKKKSDSGSGVVTCQMAGYPANYAWNEAAKACQPGFIDANGVFHSTASGNRKATPNTADVSNSLYLMIGSMLMAMLAAYLLKRDE